MVVTVGFDVATVVLFVGFGVVIGILFGFFGMGGSFLVTPALLASAYPARVAVGSGLAFVFGTSVVGALSHRDRGRIDYTLAAVTILGMTLGIEVGTRVVFLLEERGSAASAVSVAYVGLLAFVGLFTLYDSRSDHTHPGRGRLAARVQTVRLPPTVTLADGRRVSAWVVLLVGTFVGVLSGFLGVGGGILLLPAMLYGLGVPVAVAVGTDSLQIAVSSAYGAFVYAEADAVALPAVGSLLVGSAFGARVGAGATTLVEGDALVGYFAAMLLAASLSIAGTELADHLGIEALASASTALLFGAPVLVSAAVVLAAVRGLRRDGVGGTDSV